MLTIVNLIMSEMRCQMLGEDFDDWTIIVQQPSFESSGREKCTDDETLTAHVPGKKKRHEDSVKFIVCFILNDIFR